MAGAEDRSRGRSKMQGYKNEHRNRAVEILLDFWFPVPCNTAIAIVPSAPREANIQNSDINAASIAAIHACWQSSPL